jgi:hypothetical protein
MATSGTAAFNLDLTELSELWMPVPQYVGGYEVSTLGRVRSVARIVDGRWGPTALQGKLLRPVRAGGKYYKVTLQADGVAIQMQVHTLVLSAFLGTAPEGFHCDHIDFDITNNQLTNLRWIHPLDNLRRRRNMKLTHALVRSIRDKHSAGNSVVELAAEFSISARHIAQVVTRSRWKDTA